MRAGDACAGRVWRLIRCKFLKFGSRNPRPPARHARRVLTATAPCARNKPQVVEAIKDLIEDANFECNSTGFNLQAMDSSHVSLVSLNLRSDAFEHYRCDRNVSMGMKLQNLSKVLKCGNNNDAVTMRSEDDGDTIAFAFESKAQDRLAEFDLKLMDIDSEQLGIPDSEYEVVIEMPSAEFKRICSDLATIGDTVNISAQKDHVKFSASGDIGTANVMIRPHAAADSEAKTTIQVDSPVAQDFALRYMNSFSKASPLADQVVIKLSNELPIVVEYIIENVGKLGFFLAPKIEEDMEA